MSEDVPVFVMLPLDTVNADGVFQYATAPWFTKALYFLSNSGVKGVAVDCWWGAVEKSPKKYDFSAYRQVCTMLKRFNLKLQVVMSFHACGVNVNDNVHIPLPAWVQECGRTDPDIWYTNQAQPGHGGGGLRRNNECVSLFADHVRCLAGRTPIECYQDCMNAFHAALGDMLGTVIEEVVVGMGPCGELRYPSYSEANGWKFPGVGQFQMYDRRALASLAQAAREAGHAEWAAAAPPGVGHPNSLPQETSFFTWDGGWQTPRGDFFLKWYSGCLQAHATRMLAAAVRSFHGCLGAEAQEQIRKRGEVDVAGLPCEPSHTGRCSEAGAPEALGSCVAAMRGRRQASLSSLQSRPGVTDRLCDLADGVGVGSTPGESVSVSGSATGRTWGWFGCVDGGGKARTDVSSSPRPRADAGSPTALMSPCATLADVNLAPQHPASDSGVRRPCMASGLAATSSCDGNELAGALGARDTMRRNLGCSSSSLASLHSGRQERAPVRISMKIAGVHWWYHTPSHAAELTAGYYNTSYRDGYSDILRSCADHAAGIILTCVEMCDTQHPPEALCGPESLLRQVREAAHRYGLRIAGENALPCITGCGVNTQALEHIVKNTRASVTIPRRASDVATRCLAQCHYQNHPGPFDDVAIGSNGPADLTHDRHLQHAHDAWCLQGPVPLPHSISFSPPVQQYFLRGGLQRSSDAVMRKATSSLDLKGPLASETGWHSMSDPSDGNLAQRGDGKAGAGVRMRGTISKQSLQSLTEAIPEGRCWGAEGPQEESPGTGSPAGSGLLVGDVVTKLPAMRMFTFLRMTQEMLQPGPSGQWMHFMWRMRSDMQWS